MYKCVWNVQSKVHKMACPLLYKNFWGYDYPVLKIRRQKAKRRQGVERSRVEMTGEETRLI